MIHYPRDKNRKLVIRFEVRSFLSRGYFPKYSHLAIPAKLHGPKGDRINESLLYSSTFWAKQNMPRGIWKRQLEWSLS